jgi:hypothetical protein
VSNALHNRCCRFGRNLLAYNRGKKSFETLRPNSRLRVTKIDHGYRNIGIDTCNVIYVVDDLFLIQLILSQQY